MPEWWGWRLPLPWLSVLGTRARGFFVLQKRFPGHARKYRKHCCSWGPLGQAWCRRDELQRGTCPKYRSRCDTCPSPAYPTTFLEECYYWRKTTVKQRNRRKPKENGGYLRSSKSPTVSPASRRSAMASGNFKRREGLKYSRSSKGNCLRTTSNSREHLDFNPSKI
jgi:hypothetical protein